MTVARAGFFTLRNSVFNNSNAQQHLTMFNNHQIIIGKQAVRYFRRLFIHSAHKKYHFQKII